MEIIYHSESLNFVLFVWVGISFVAAPLVGRFVAAALRERTDNPQRTTPAGTSGTGEAPQTAPFPRLQAGHNVSS